MKFCFDINDQNRIEIDEFNESLDLSLHFRQPRGEWITTGAIILTPDQAKTLGLALINRHPDAAKVLKMECLSEANQEKLRSEKRARRRVPVPKSLADVFGADTPPA